ncbi:MAG: DegV family protein [Clostridia bacterium]|nr:DegV family protein [Clostridia bacterium]
MKKERIAVITDTASDLDKEYLSAHEDLFVLPLRLNVGDKSLIDGADITTEEVLARMEAGETFKTSLPSPEDAERILAEIKARGIKKVVSVHIASGLSGTLAMMRLMADQHKDELEIKFFDTKILSMSEGYMVKNAVELVESGYPYETIIEKMTALRNDVDGYFYIPTLKYLAAGGRIGSVAKYLGNLMNIKPLIGCEPEEGRYYPRKICIGAKRTMLAARDECRAFVENRIAEVTVLHAGAKEEAEKLAASIKAVCQNVKTSISELTPSLSVHVGRGMMAVCTRRFS